MKYDRSNFGASGRTFDIRIRSEFAAPGRTANLPGGLPFAQRRSRSPLRICRLRAPGYFRPKSGNFRRRNVHFMGKTRRCPPHFGENPGEIRPLPRFGAKFAPPAILPLRPMEDLPGRAKLRRSPSQTPLCHDFLILHLHLPAENREFLAFRGWLRFYPCKFKKKDIKIVSRLLTAPGIGSIMQIS